MHEYLSGPQHMNPSEPRPVPIGSPVQSKRPPAHTAAVRDIMAEVGAEISTAFALWDPFPALRVATNTDESDCLDCMSSESRKDSVGETDTSSSSSSYSSTALPGKLDDKALNVCCGHREHWKRLRSKQGTTFFSCKFCKAHWRHKSKQSTPNSPNTSCEAVMSQ